MAEPVLVYIINAAKDRRYREALERHLGVLERNDKIRLFSEERIPPGLVISTEVDKALRAARLVIPLVSSDLLAEPRCVEQVQKAMQAGVARVIPILVRATLWRSSLIGALQILPADGTPVRSVDDTDDVWMKVAEALERTILELRGEAPAAPAPAATAGTVATAAANPTQDGRVDLGILVALREEFRHLFMQIRGAHTAETRDGHTYFRYTQLGPKDQPPYQCVAVHIGEMNPVPAALATRRLIDEYRPAVVAMLGIAGGLGGDVRVGDVVAGSQVDAYLDSAQARAIPGLSDDGFDFVPGGEVYRTSPRLMDQLRNFEFAFYDSYGAWVRDGGRDLEALVPDPDARQRLLDKQIILAEPRLLDGHIASGPVVGAAAAFGKWIRRRDRKMLALEMESAGVLAAVQPNLRDVQTLVLRGVSDLSDERKAELDSLRSGALRDYAMRNVLRLMAELLRGGVLPRSQ